jgi:uncharacterized integral membrane protein (TIGR00698 family)
MRRPCSASRDRVRGLGHGLLWTLSVACVAWLLGLIVPLFGPAVIAILVGMAVGTIRRPPPEAERGIALSATAPLKLAIVLLGTGLSLGQISRVGGRSLPVMLGTLAVALVGSVLLGRLLAVPPRLRTLIGVGTGICGASAIAAVSGIVEASAAEIAYAISTIFVFNIAAVVVFPVLGHIFHLSQHGFGLWAGTAVNDTSSVVAAAYAYGHLAGAQAVVVKLTRTTLIVPLALTLSAWQIRTAAREGRSAVGGLRAWRLVPWFLIGFLLTSLLNTAGLIPSDLHRPLSDTALALITVALAGVGLSSDLRLMRQAGPRPLLLGAILWASVATTSILLQAVTDQL